jgi:hypothetical protein
MRFAMAARCVGRFQSPFKIIGSRSELARDALPLFECPREPEHREQARSYAAVM